MISLETENKIKLFIEIIIYNFDIIINIIFLFCIMGLYINLNKLKEDNKNLNNKICNIEKSRSMRTLSIRFNRFEKIAEHLKNEVKNYGLKIKEFK